MSHYYKIVIFNCNNASSPNFNSYLPGVKNEGAYYCNVLLTKNYC